MEENTNHFRTLLNLARHLWPKEKRGLKLRVIGAVICLLLAKVINVYVPFLYKDAVDALSLSGASLLIPISVIIGYGAARLGTQVFGELRDVLFVNVSQYAQRMIALKTFEHLHALSLRFHLQRQTGGLSRVIERGVRGISFVLSFMLFNILPTLLEIFMVSIILGIKFNVVVSAISFFTIFGYILFTLAVTEWRLKYRRKMIKSDNEANTKAIDSLLNFETVKYFSNEAMEYERYNKSLLGYEKAAIKSQSSLMLVNLGQGFIIALGLTIVMWMVAGGVVEGKFSVGDFVLVNTYLIQLYLPLNFLGFVYREMKQSLVDMEKMFTLLSEEREIKDQPNSLVFKSESALVSFENVDFGYDPKRQVLKNVSFSINPGKMLAVVGPSGSGKSTIARLMFRFYDVNGGQISINKKSIKEYSQASLRSHIGVVPQDTVLFNDTIYYNLKYGQPSASKEQVMESARLAQVDSFIEKLPEKYQSMVGERGLKLSGGEKQRIAIARTILKNAPILILDEATSALDSKTEEDIQKALAKIAKNRTTLVIAHRLSTIVDADEIIVLKDGEIVERGNHQQLLKNEGEYYQMWLKQQQEAT